MDPGGLLDPAALEFWGGAADDGDVRREGLVLGTEERAWLGRDCCDSGCSSLHLMSGSWMNASSIAINESWCCRRTDITRSQVERKVPSTALTSIALTSILVSRNGTVSGNFSRRIATSKQSPKSIWSIFPLCFESIKLEGCRSPNPSMWPTILIVASEREKFDRRSSHTSDEGAFSQSSW
eukprot:CAMPEP_0181197174 /NCGR_PEP_ID=MMETSP1096-20121128/15889_1 /TAXON_ID=156174 ORGANISM="Chrysochromulina ericina, Strain CCMP281" /NCGR_SAMPLE_ID=MMETSP1096 /ASSEMBLY_ACC=CAM_ASM_000453 /LENGTH=180 /DNA_ID=CAMNT_0023287045 /DNA_START=849 /DNA_END=1392 /DNA_ORIENTATION=-